MSLSRRERAVPGVLHPLMVDVGIPLVETPQQIGRVEWLARDLYRACIHEVGHAAVAAHCGIAGQVRIISNPAGGQEQKHYVGQYQLLAAPTERESRLIGLAGTIAECYWSDQLVTESDISDFIDCGVIELSPSDAELAGEYTMGNVKTCLRIVTRYWPRMSEVAKSLARPDVVNEPPRRMDWTTFRVRSR